MLTKYRKNCLAYTLFFCVFLLSSCAEKAKMPSMFSDSAVARFEKDLSGKSASEKVQMARSIVANSSQSEQLKNRAYFILASINNSQTPAALSALAKRYKSSTTTEKIYMEETLFSDFETVPNDDVFKTLSLITPELESHYPYILTIYVAAQRRLLQNSPAILQKLSSHEFFKSSKLIGKTVPSTSVFEEKVSSGAVAILLPHSGNIATLSKQIIAGVEAARLYLEGIGSSWKVYYIDTENPTWLQQVLALPKNCVTIGGPLRATTYNSLKANGVLNNHAVFSFLPRLPDPADEGVLSWQFFTKPDDQVNAMLDVASQSLGITAFGVFSPMTPYGNSMANLFTQTAQSRGFTVVSAQYPPEEMNEWTKLARDFLDVRLPNEKDKKATPTVRAPIDAIFFPDAWRNMDLLISTMHYYGAHKKVMLGNAFWEQNLSTAQNFDPKTFALTLFPVAYESKRSSPIQQLFVNSLRKEKMDANDWTALGFDFMIMASQLGLSSMQDAMRINTRLAALQINYVSAPFSWTHSGISSRRLFINQPAREGRVPLDLPQFLQYRVDGKAIPNAGVNKLSDEAIRNQEKQALEQLDSLVDDILSP